MGDAAELIDVWWMQGEGESDEQEMEDAHAQLWSRMIDLIVEKNLSDKTVFDFGCNQGGFLRALYKRIPFMKGIGVDVAKQAIEVAKSRSGSLPLSYDATGSIEKYKDVVDVMFSHDVIYLLPDLAAHARDVKTSLKKGGVYYISTTCHTDNPQWPRWKEEIRKFSVLPIMDYSLGDVSSVFHEAGFKVSAQPMMTPGFILQDPNDVWTPTPMDSFDYHYRSSVVFRMIAK